MRHILIFAFSLFSMLLTAQQSTFFSSDIASAMEDQKTVDLMVEMRAQWEASNHIRSWSKADKGAYVYESLKAFAKVEQKEIIQYLKSNQIDFESFFIFNGFKISMNKMQLDKFLQQFAVKAVYLDKAHYIADFYRATDDASRGNNTWGVNKIEAPYLWDLGFKGKGVVVAGQDTGYDYKNPYIRTRYRGFVDTLNYTHDYNWHDAIVEKDTNNFDENPCGLASKVPCDDHGHGSHTMGTMVGEYEMNNIGVAPDATWISCRCMEQGWGKPSTYTKCFEWFLAPTDLNDENPDPSKAPDVIANSWGCPTKEGCNPENWHVMEKVVNNLVAAGVMVVVSAGNDGSRNCSSLKNPAAIFDQAFVVGASNGKDSIAWFSSIGPVAVDGSFRIKPDVVAPGVYVKSITLNGIQGWSGTSMAGPHVAGAAALLINANPDLKGQVHEIQNILEQTAKSEVDTMVCADFSSDMVPNFVYGYGRIDLKAAYDMAKNYVANTTTTATENLQIIPNPNSGSFYLKYKDLDVVPAKIRVLNQLGAVVFIGQVDSETHMLNTALTPGVYILQIELKGHIVNKRFIVVR